MRCMSPPDTKRTSMSGG